MRTGSLRIGRGMERGESPPARLTVVESAAAAPAPAPESPAPGGPPSSLQLRLEAYERLSRLHAAGELSDAEFDLEKALVRAAFGAPAEPHAAGSPALAERRRGPSLLARLFRPGFLVSATIVGAVIGLAGSPHQATRLVEEGLRLFGA